MSAQSDNAGTSRRDVLRGGAIGVGALVGALALINADEESSEATTSTGRSMSVAFAGNGMTLAHPKPLQSFALGGEVDGAPVPTQTTLTLDISNYSPRLLQAYAEAITLSKIVINGYQPNVQGLKTLVLTITLANVRITSFHTNVDVGSGHVRDTLTVTWGSWTLLRKDANRTFTWTPVV